MSATEDKLRALAKAPEFDDTTTAALMVAAADEIATLRAAYRWFRKYPEFVPNMDQHGKRVIADIEAARNLFPD